VAIAEVVKARDQIIQNRAKTPIKIIIAATIWVG